MMYTFFASLLLSLLVFKSQAADPTCLRGLKSPNNPVCCSSYCGVCDDGACASRPGGLYEVSI
jgi:hypothetical protein